MLFRSNIAIEADRPLQGAQISILLSGDVEVDGYVDRHELSWFDDLEPGVTELCLRPAIDTGELRAAAPDWVTRVTHHAIVTDNRWFPTLLERAGVSVVGYRTLRDAQRAPMG